jgi:hypothetical protein
MTPRTWSPCSIGSRTPRAGRIDANRIDARGKFVSLTASGIQAGWRLAHTRPGRPMPLAKLVLRLTVVNRSNWDEASGHVAKQRSTPAPRSTRQSAPYSQPSASHIASSIRGAASASVADSASAHAVS